MLDLVADLSGLTNELYQLRLIHLRICEALERLSPPLAADDSEARSVRPPDPRTDGFHLAESPAEYQERIDSEAAFAASLGVAPWSPDFQKVIMEVRAELMRPRRIQNEETGDWSDAPALSDEEADDAIRKGFRLAKAEANRLVREETEG